MDHHTTVASVESESPNYQNLEAEEVKSLDFDGKNSSMSFLHPGNLENYLSTHTGQRPFVGDAKESG